MMQVSDAEAALMWQMQALSVDLPVTEYRFAAPRRWRFDFAWPDRMLAVEVEGGSWTNGRHTTGAGYEADCEKYTEAALMGWCVIRVTPRMIRDGIAINYVVRGLTMRQHAATLTA